MYSIEQRPYANKRYFTSTFNGPFVYGGLTVLGAGTLPISFFSDSVKIMRFYDFAPTSVS